jgi:tetratricopeptide (TPR) repeat protein
MDELALCSTNEPGNLTDNQNDAYNFVGVSEGVQINSIEKKDLPFPKDGLTLREMRAFMDTFSLRDSTMTTTEVCQQCLLPATACQSSSYCDLLKQRGSPEVGIATVFISHAWKYRFVDVVDALEYHFRDDPDIFIWFDLFANNQHAAGNLPFEWWATTFKSAIAQFGRVVMVLSPWSDPIPFTRAWCLFEVYSAVSTNSRFEVAMSKSDFNLFLESMKSDVDMFFTMLGTIDLLRCEAFNPDDKDRIFEVVKTEVGFSTLNSMVKGKMREWVDATLSSRINDALIHGNGTVTVEAIEDRYTYGSTLIHMGQYEKALDIFQKCMEDHVTLGHSPIQYKHVFNNIGVAYGYLGRYEESLEYHKKNLDINLESVDEHHRDVALAFRNIGNRYKSLGQYEKALEYHKKAVDITIESRGALDLDVAASYDCIRETYNSLGRYEESLEYCKKSLFIKNKSYGKRHASIAVSYNSIGSILQNIGQYEEALENHKNALDILIECLGKHHIHVTSSYNNIGTVLQYLGRYEAAIDYHQKALDLTIESHGEHNNYVAVTASNIGSAYQSIGRYKEAQEYHKKALDIKIESSGEHHPTVASSYNNIGAVCQSLGRYEEALDFYNKSYKILIDVFGDFHPNLVISYNNMVEVLIQMGDFAKCKDLLKKALDIAQSHSVMLSYVHFRFGEMYLYQGNNSSEATHYFQLCLEARRESYGSDSNHAEIADCLYGLGMVCVNEGSYDEALSYLSKCLAMRLSTLPIRHPDVARAYYGLGVMYSRQDNMIEEARENLSKALDIQIDVLGEQHNHTIQTRECLNHCRSTC